TRSRFEFRNPREHWTGLVTGRESFARRSNGNQQHLLRIMDLRAAASAVQEIDPEISMHKVDLLLGSEIGKWALQQVQPDDIHQVFTCDSEIAALAARDGIKVHYGDINSCTD